MEPQRLSLKSSTAQLRRSIQDTRFIQNIANSSGRDEGRKVKKLLFIKDRATYVLGPRPNKNTKKKENKRK